MNPESSWTGAASRAERMRELLEEMGCGCLIAAGPQNVNHVLGYWSYFGSPAAAVLGTDGAISFMVARDEAPRAGRELPGVTVSAYGSRGFGLVPDQSRLLAAALAELPALRDAARICIASEVPGLARALQGHTDAPLLDVEAALARIRLVKDGDEVARIRDAYELAWAAQAAVAAQRTSGSSEIELFTAGMSAAQLRAGQPIEFLGDLLGGERSADVCAPISIAGRRQVQEGEALVSDLVVGLRGYWGDTAETYAVGDAPEVLEVRTRLREILASCSRMLRPGSTGAEVFAAMKDAIHESYPHGEFPHHGGHGVGLGSYEDPHVIPGDTMPLQAGMVLALEPGVYFPGRFGVRVEEMFLVTTGGGRELRSLPPDPGP